MACGTSQSSSPPENGDNEALRRMAFEGVGGHDFIYVGLKVRRPTQVITAGPRTPRTCQNIFKNHSNTMGKATRRMRLGPLRLLRDGPIAAIELLASVSRSILWTRRLFAGPPAVAEPATHAFRPRTEASTAADPAARALQAPAGSTGSSWSHSAGRRRAGRAATPWRLGPTTGLSPGAFRRARRP